MPTTNDIYLQRYDGAKWAEKLGFITISSGGLIGINTSSPAFARLHISQATSDIGGNASIRLEESTTNKNVYLQWFNSTTPEIYFNDSSAYFQLRSHKTLVLGTNAAGIVLTVKGAASQSANLQEWQNSSGTILAQIDSAGGVYFNKATGNTSISTSGTDTIIKNWNAALIRFQSNTGQSFENSSGTSYFKTSSAGAVVLNTLLVIAGDGSAATGIKLEQVYSTSYYYLTMRHGNGGGTCGMKIFAANDMANSALSQIEINATATDFVSTSTGTGTTVPIRFLIDSTEVLRMSPSGVISFSGVAATDVALKQNGTELQVRLGDDSDFGNLKAAEVVFGGGTIAATASTLGLFGATPAAQPTTGITAASFTANTSAIADDTATWDGYTIGQVVAALRSIGMLA